MPKDGFTQLDLNQRKIVGDAQTITQQTRNVISGNGAGRRERRGFGMHDPMGDGVDRILLRLAERTTSEH